MNSSKRVLITQSNYIPWKGYFDAINSVDHFVLYDDMQFTKRDWRNRNKIKTPQGIHWLTIPVNVKGRFDQKISETIVNDPSWASDHWQTIRHNYKKARFFDEVSRWLEPLYTGLSEDNLSQINFQFLRAVNHYLGIITPMTFSSTYQFSGDKNQKLVDICRQLQASEYWSGPAAKEYLDEALFEQEGVKVNYFDFAGYKEYPQLHGPFEHAVSIIDLLMNTGTEAKLYMKSFGEKRSAEFHLSLNQ